MNYDYYSLYKRNSAFLKSHPRFLKGVVLFNLIVPYFFLAAYLFLWAYGFFWGNFAPKDYMKLFFLPALALVLVTVLRLGIDRPRPYSEEGEGITPMRTKKGNGHSFPSRHLACAAVIALAFIPHLSAVSAALYFLSMALGYTRFALGWHYPSDVIVGLLLGTVVGSLTFIL